MKSIFKFSKFTRRNLVPNILKDPKFTRTGIVAKKNKQQFYDLSNVENPEFYHVKEKPQIKKKKGGQAFPSNQKQCLEWLLDKERLNKGSRSMLCAIVILQKLYPEQVEENKDIIQNALYSIHTKIYRLQINHFAVFSSHVLKYIPQDRQVFESLKQMFLKFLQDNTNQDFNYFSKRPRIRSFFIEALNNLYQLGQIQNQPNLQEILNLVEQLYDCNSLHRTRQQILYLTSISDIRQYENDEEFNEKQEKINKELNELIYYNRLSAIDCVHLFRQFTKSQGHQLTVHLQTILDKYTSIIQRTIFFKKTFIKNFALFQNILAHNKKLVNVKQYLQTAPLVYEKIKDRFNERDWCMIIFGFKRLGIVTQEMFQDFEKYVKVSNLDLIGIIQVIHNSRGKWVENHSLQFNIDLINHFEIKCQDSDLQNIDILSFKIYLDELQPIVQGKIIKTENIQQILEDRNLEFTPL